MVIYKIKNLLNNKIYIGSTTRSIETRFKEHGMLSSGCINLRRAIQKYGIQNFTISIIARCESHLSMKNRERYYIHIFNTLAPNGYNLKDAGHNGSFSKETCEKISMALRGQVAYNKGLTGTKNPLYGRKRAKSVVNKIAKKNTGKKRSSAQCLNIAKAMIGKYHTIATKIKISNKMLEVCKTRDINSYRKMSATKKNKPITANYKPIMCVETKNIYLSIGHAAIELSINRVSISRVLNKKQDYVKGISFVFL